MEGRGISEPFMVGDATQLKRLERYPFAMYAFERTRVVFIVTDTPEEYEALKKTAG